MSSVQDLETRLLVVEAKVAYILQAFTVHKKKGEEVVTNSLLDEYYEAMSSGAMMDHVQKVKGNGTAN